MPLPQAIARFNVRYTNRFIEPLVARLPGFVVVTHTGRSTGTTYQTPLYAFTSGPGLLIALTYGPNADWAQNVLKHGGAIARRNDRVAITSSAVVGRSSAWPYLPAIVRAGLRVARVTEFLEVQVNPPLP